MSDKPKRKIIGWREYVSLPALDIHDLKVKVDSGAATCALHATGIRYLEGKDGETWVSFEVTSSLKPLRRRRVRARLVTKRKVKSSMGHASVRPVIETELRLGEDTWPVEITLVNRDPMGFRMLIGRRALRGRFLIHPTRSFLQSSEPKDGK